MALPDFYSAFLKPFQKLIFLLGHEKEKYLKITLLPSQAILLDDQSHALWETISFMFSKSFINLIEIDQNGEKFRLENSWINQ